MFGDGGSGGSGSGVLRPELVSFAWLVYAIRE